MASLGAGSSRTSALGSQAANWQTQCAMDGCPPACIARAPAAAISAMCDSHAFIAGECDALLGTLLRAR